jgi:hypothetical protein
MSRHRQCWEEDYDFSFNSGTFKNYFFSRRLTGLFTPNTAFLNTIPPIKVDILAFPLDNLYGL